MVLGPGLRQTFGIRMHALPPRGRKVRLKLGAPWLENGSLVRLGNNEVFTNNIPSRHAHYLCWHIGTMDRS